MADKYDLIVIGAGINGVGIAKLAVECGLKVLLLEQFDEPAKGTSSKSSKLIHGGLRYLESGEIKFVYKSLREREHLLKDYPELVKLKPFYIPVYKDSNHSILLLYMGLFMYWALSLFHKTNTFRRLPKSEFAKLDGMRLDNLKAVFEYHDAQTDDRKLTQKILQEAIADGLQVKFSSKVSTIELTDNLSRISCEDGVKARAEYIVNAAGPWVNQVLDKVNEKVPRLEVDLVQGTHLVVKGKIEYGLYYVEAHDGRAVFIMPWYGNMLIGTTEKLHEGEPQAATATEAEVDYLIKVFNHYFPSHSISTTDVIEKMAGLRVLPKTDSAIFSRSREVKMLSDREQKPRLVSIYGGKLTSWHSTAVEVIQALGK